MEFGELIEHEGAGLVCGCDTGRVIAKFSHEQEADFFVSAYNEPSDLEIVQKAVVKERAGIEFNTDGGWMVCIGVQVLDCGGDNESLLTWAKQTVGEG